MSLRDFYEGLVESRDHTSYCAHCDEKRDEYRAAVREAEEKAARLDRLCVELIAEKREVRTQRDAAQSELATLDAQRAWWQSSARSWLAQYEDAVTALALSRATTQLWRGRAEKAEKALAALADPPRDPYALAV